jgi:alpha-ketoglutarate-dependent taurine dioxygenase
MMPLKKLEEFFCNHKYLYYHEWGKEDILFADNISLLHGREKITNKENGIRHLRRIQIN